MRLETAAKEYIAALPKPDAVMQNMHTTHRSQWSPADKERAQDISLAWRRLTAIQRAMHRWVPNGPEDMDMDMDVDTDASNGTKPKKRAASAGGGVPPDKLVQRCPAAGCLGFVTSATMKCGLCSVALCKKCRNVLDVGPDTAPATHVCSSEDVATVAMLRADTKPCPKCAAPIYKIDGCDQMWCTACHVAFSWKTGTEVTTAIHNPHYYAYMRATHGGVVPPQAGPLPRCNHLTNPAVIAYAFGPSYRLALHMQHEGVGTVTEPCHATLRAKFLTGAICEKEFKRRVFLADRQAERRRESAMVAQTVIQVLLDMSTQLAREEVVDRRRHDAAAQQAAALIAYANSCWEALAKLHKVYFPRITQERERYAGPGVPPYWMYRKYGTRV
jgi:hypothetical protein